jgi:hypothetical protein
MDQEGFEQLCRDTGIALNAPDIDALISQQQITLNGVDIGLFFDEFSAADRIVCYIDIGKLPDAGREDVLARMLAINVLTGTKTSGVYGLDPQRDHIIFVQHFLYPEMLTGTSLATILQEYSEHARNTRKTILEASSTEGLNAPVSRSSETPLSSLA